jgi:soluble lytic murein transglycosylase-like protein
MHRRHRWLAIAAALWLLAGAGVVDHAVQVARAMDDAATVDVRTATAEDLLRAWTVARLQDWNPRLAAHTSNRIASAVLRCTRERELATDLVLAVMFAESDAKVFARSPKGAIGLMQVMPHMFERLDLPGNVAHIEANVEAGCLLLADNIRRLGEERGISAYFWGSHIRGDGYLQRVQRIRKGLTRRGVRLSQPMTDGHQGRG